MKGYNRFLLSLCINLIINFPVYNSHKVFVYKFGFKNTALDNKRCHFTSYHSRMSMVYNYMQYQHQWRILI